MPAAVTLITPIVTATPGMEAIAEMRVRNTGDIVDQFAFNLVGDAAAFGVFDPPFLSLFPGAEETVRVRFTPPRSSSVTAGAIPFGVRITSKEDTGFSQVEEGSIQISGFASLQTRLVPRTSEGKRGAVHRLEVTNTGNAPVNVAVDALDPDTQLVFSVAPDQIEVGPGDTEVVRIQVRAKKGVRGKAPKTHQFTVNADPGTGPVRADAQFQQTPKGSLLLFLAIAVVAVILIVLVKDQAGAETLGAIIAGW